MRFGGKIFGLSFSLNDEEFNEEPGDEVINEDVSDWDFVNLNFAFIFFSNSSSLSLSIFFAF